MEIKIRYLKKDIVDRIDILASKEGFKSRNEFLAKKLEDIAFESEKKQLEEDYINVINSLITVTENHTKVLGSFMDQFIIDSEEAYKLDLNYTEIKNSLREDSPTLNIEDVTSEIRVKYVPKDVVTRIKEICDEREINQNDFLIKYLSQLTYSNSLKLINERYEYTIKKVLGLLDFSNRVLTLFYNENHIDSSRFYEGDNI